MTLIVSGLACGCQIRANRSAPQTNKPKNASSVAAVQADLEPPALLSDRAAVQRTAFAIADDENQHQPEHESKHQQRNTEQPADQPVHFRGDLGWFGNRPMLRPPGRRRCSRIIKPPSVTTVSSPIRRSTFSIASV